MSEVLNRVQGRVEGGVLELVNNTTKALPDVLRIAEALNTMGNLSLYSTSKQTLKNLAHAEESEVNVGALHSLKVMHLLILLVINLVKKLLPLVGKVKEELLMVDHLGLSIEEHGGSLTKVLSSINPFAHTIVMNSLTSILKDINAIDNERLVGLEEDLFRVEEGFSHPLDLLVVVVIDFATMVEHVTDVGDGEAELIDGLDNLLVGAIPETAH